MWQHVIYTCKNEEMSQSLTYFAIYIYQIVYVLQKIFIYIYIYKYILYLNWTFYVINKRCSVCLILSIPHLSNFF